MERPNLLLIMADQMRGDCLGIMGHPDVKTPHLDSLGAQGIVWENAYSACPSCIPARAALMTGMLPKNHGRVGYEDGVRWDYKTTLAGSLTAGGYQTQCVGKMHVHPLRSSQGFQGIELHDGNLNFYRNKHCPRHLDQREADDYYHWIQREMGIDTDVKQTGLDCNSWVSRPWMYAEKYHPTNWVADRTIDFIRRRDWDKPFFLFSSFVRPHPPFDAPACYFDMYRNKRLRPPVMGDWASAPSYPDNRIHNGLYASEDPDLIHEQQTGYYACITHLDHQIGRIIGSLQENGLLENTVVLFTADHGEMLSDHGFTRKSCAYEGSAHIPMLMFGPERWIGKGGKTISAVVELCDIMPTLLDLAGLDIPLSVDGSNILSADKNPRSFLHGEHLLGERSSHFIVTEQDKYIWFSQTGQEQYFDFTNDPMEIHNRISDPTSENRIAKLRNYLEESLAGREEGFWNGQRLVAGRPIKTVLSNLRK